MEVYRVNKKDFYKKGNRGEFRYYRKQLDLIKEKLNEQDLEGALALASLDPYVDRPEFNYYRINLLLRLRRIDEDISICNDERFVDFKPIQVLKAAIIEYQKLNGNEDKLENKEDLLVKSNEIKNEVSENQEIQSKKDNPNKAIIDIKKPKYITNEGEVLKKTEPIQSKVSKNDNEVLQTDLTIKEAFPRQTLAIGAYVYSMVNSILDGYCTLTSVKSTEVVKAMDNFYNLVNKKVSDKDALSSFEYYVSQYSKIDKNIDYNEKAFEKYLSK